LKRSGSFQQQYGGLNMSILFTNLLILGVIMTAALVIGWQTYLLIQLPVLWFAGAAGIWLFYVQHQFEGGYWARKSEWEPLRAALEGSSFYKLPVVFTWFSGNIGYHHVHHLGPKIPNYRLRRVLKPYRPYKPRHPSPSGRVFPVFD
jgi:acyl-lipid omega-6 desaturase (Delta-12 desaturase)